MRSSVIRCMLPSAEAGTAEAGLSRQFLHASSLTLQRYPDNERRMFVAPLAYDLTAWLQQYCPLLSIHFVKLMGPSCCRGAIYSPFDCQTRIEARSFYMQAQHYPPDTGSFRNF